MGLILFKHLSQQKILSELYNQSGKQRPILFTEFSVSHAQSVLDDCIFLWETFKIATMLCYPATINKY